jgi:hypothetical protein
MEDPHRPAGQSLPASFKASFPNAAAPGRRWWPPYVRDARRANLTVFTNFDEKPKCFPEKRQWMPGDQ